MICVRESIQQEVKETYMSNVKRVFVEKKPEFAVAAKELRHEIRHYLGIRDVSGVRVLIRYDVENLSVETFEKRAKACSQSRLWISSTKKNFR